MKNRLTDLNSYLFEALDRITNDELTGEVLEEELKRANMVSHIATTAIKNGELAFRVMQHRDKYGYEKADKSEYKMLEGD